MIKLNETFQDIIEDEFVHREWSCKIFQAPLMERHKPRFFGRGCKQVLIAEYPDGSIEVTGYVRTCEFRSIDPICGVLKQLVFLTEFGFEVGYDYYLLDGFPKWYPAGLYKWREMNEQIESVSKVA